MESISVNERFNVAFHLRNLVILLILRYLVITMDTTEYSYILNTIPFQFCHWVQE